MFIVDLKFFLATSVPCTYSGYNICIIHQRGESDMSIFSFLANPEKKRNANIELAEALLSAQTLPAGEKGSRQIEKILKQCSTRQAILEKVIELCGEPATPRQRYICAVAYTRGKADYRDKAIQALESYLANSPCEEAYKNAHHIWGNKSLSADDERKIHLADMYAHLGKAYEDSHAFSQALASYNKELELTPFDAAAYCRISSAHVKKNQMTSAMNILLSARKSHYYKPIKYKTASGDTVTDDTFKKVIDNHIIDLEKKIENGYVYIPKKRK